jgi:hypothetical protein
MRLCPKCSNPLKKETKEIYNGVFADVTVCPNCEEDLLLPVNGDEEHALFQRKAFRAGGSLAVRLPKEIVNALEISEGSEINFKVYPNGVFIKVNGVHKQL